MSDQPFSVFEHNIGGEFHYCTAENAVIAGHYHHGKFTVRLVDVPRSPAIHFKRHLKHEPAPIGNRRLAAARRALRNEQLREGGPLFAEHVAATQPTPQERCEKFDDANRQSMIDDRMATAQRWRRCRAMLLSYPPRERDLIVHIWNAATYPLDSNWFETFLKNMAGKLVESARYNGKDEKNVRCTDQAQATDSAELIATGA